MLACWTPFRSILYCTSKDLSPTVNLDIQNNTLFILSQLITAMDTRWQSKCESILPFCDEITRTERKNINWVRLRGFPSVAQVEPGTKRPQQPISEFVLNTTEYFFNNHTFQQMCPSLQLSTQSLGRIAIFWTFSSLRRGHIAISNTSFNWLSCHEWSTQSWTSPFKAQPVVKLEYCYNAVPFSTEAGKQSSLITVYNYAFEEVKSK